MSKITRSSHFLERLRRNEQRGSKPRCHILTCGTAKDVAQGLTSIINDARVLVSACDSWMPMGFESTEEAQLHKAKRLIASQNDRGVLKSWWLAEPRPTSRTPTWDIASTCSIDGQSGLLLVEAKAHQDELTNEECGKRLDKGRSKANHDSIARAIAEANKGLKLATKLDWRLSLDRCYQMSNRFAWAWKLCTLEYPVALVYLGFVGATEMRGSFRENVNWQDLVRQHSAPLFPPEIWNRSISIDGVTFLPLIRTSPQSLDCVSKSDQRLRPAQ
jgi:hypothetical protein